MKIKSQIILTVCLLVTIIVKAQKPNIVWIVSEDNSKHYMELFDKNGVKTPNIEKLAKEGIVFTRAFSNAAVCSAARSTLITSTYGPKLATHYHRAEAKINLAPGQEMFPSYLRKAGYYTTNNAKEDYNIFKAENVWDDSSYNATWRNRKKGQPFFHVFNIGTTHEGQLHFSEEDKKNNKTKTDPATVFVQPNHPQTALFRYTNAFYRDKIVEMDSEVGEVINQLKDDGLLESTIIFYYGDHGGVLPYSKGYLTETGLHVPLVVYVPEKYKDLTIFEPGTKTDAFVSFVDFGATVLNIAGVEIPKNMDGKPFIGKNVTKKVINKRDYTIGYADRFDEKYDMVRSIRKGKFKYIRNFQPFNPDALMNDYRYKQLAYKEWEQLYRDGKLNKVQSKFFEPKIPEELYDVEADPFETNNLAANPNFKSTLKELRTTLNAEILKMNDLSFYPEFYLLQNAFENPKSFGETHKKSLKKYLSIANLEMVSYKKATSKLQKYLTSTDAWERYWALNVCSSFGEEAKEFTAKIIEISNSDTELINKVKAAEFLGITKVENPSKVMIKALYESKDKVEALLILNSVVLMHDYYSNYSFNIQEEKLNDVVKNSNQIKRRLAYLVVN
ncbi:Arylsulfatase A [Lutibacter agarilyticus]|uniref:Arylsulfatase A n=1 Tax=Lutibacter agarilyticus TaxID=1109740 RepID=A0A238VCE6_9FLAO|nr:sulfatase [Lutibacter agarilyticus]SNR31363.1 Arylsulfatase A [Lutibacter agarilyticus]